jgi:SAM-dependent methyltransferase
VISIRSCPACGTNTGRERGRKNNLLISSCRACGTLYAHYANGAGQSEDYDAYYHEANLTVPAFIDKRLDEIVAAFAPYRQSKRLLDVGCGAGTILQAARRAGWAAEGIEVSRPAVEHVRAAGFKAFHGELAAAHYPAGSFDVVTASEVLEHLPDPQPMLVEIARILRPGGLFWGTTPHGRGLSARALGLKWSTISPPEHLQLFSLGGLRRLLKQSGFRRVRVTSRGVNPFELWHAWRQGAGGPEANGTAADAGFDRVATGYQLNEAMTSKATTRLLKSAINGVLGATHLGDSIRVWAEK